MDATASGMRASVYYQVADAAIISTETQVEIDRKPFTVFRIEITPAAGSPWVVAKRFSEFSDLRAALAVIDKKGKQLLVKQPFPPKHLYGSMQEEVVAARLETLQSWLAEVVNHYRNAVPLLTFLADDGSENSAVDLLGAKSYLRGVELRLEKPMTAWGTRTAKEKSCYLLATKAGAVVKGPKRQILSMLTLSSPPLPVPCPVPISSKSNRGHMRSFLVDVEHPFLMPVLEVGYQLENDKVLVFREFASKGSLRDMVFRCKTPCAGAGEKYTRSAATKRAQGVNEKKVALYGRQVLEGMRYLEELGLDCGFVNCANVLCYEDGWCRISDFENALVGLPLRGAGAGGGGAGGGGEEPAGVDVDGSVGSAAGGPGGRKSDGPPPAIVFGQLLYELATGVEMPDLGGGAGAAAGAGAEAFTMPACPIQIQRVLDMIFNRDESLSSSGVEGARMAGGAGGGGDSVVGLLALPFFNQVELHPRQQEACTPVVEKTKKLKKRLAKSTAPPKEKSKSSRKSLRMLADRPDDDVDLEEGEAEELIEPGPPPPPVGAAAAEPEPEAEVVAAPSDLLGAIRKGTDLTYKAA